MFFSKFTGVIRRKWLAPLAFALALAGCGEQDLSVLTCGVTPSPDSHEPDDSRTQAMSRAPLVSGVPFSGTADSYFHRDVFELTTTGGDVTIDLTFLHSEGDLDMFLFDETGAVLIEAAESETDNEQIALTGMDAPAGTYYLLVRLFGCPMNQPLPLYYDLEFVETP